MPFGARRLRVKVPPLSGGGFPRRSGGDNSNNNMNKIPPSLLAAARRRIGDVPIRNAELAWNPGTDEIMVLPHPYDPKRFGFDDRLLECTAGAVYAYWDGFTRTERQAALLTEAMRMIVMGDVPHWAVHEALLAIPEYRAVYGPEIPKPLRP